MKVKYRIAEVVVEIETDLIINLNMELYSQFHSELPPDIQVRVLEYKLPELSQKLICHKTYDWNVVDGREVMIFTKRGIYLDECSKDYIWILEKVSCDGKRWYLKIPSNSKVTEVERELQIRPWLQRMIGRLFLDTNSAVMHGALVNIEGTGALFLGDSGAGKSTICSMLSKRYSVLADDRVVINIQGDHVIAHGTPWNIKNREYNIQDQVEIKRVFFLEHGNNSIEYLENTNRIALMISRQIIISNNTTEQVVLWKIKMGKRMCDLLKCLKVTFSLDKQIIECLERECRV